MFHAVSSLGADGVGVQQAQDLGGALAKEGLVVLEPFEALMSTSCRSGSGSPCRIQWQMAMPAPPADWMPMELKPAATARAAPGPLGDVVVVGSERLRSVEQESESDLVQHGDAVERRHEPRGQVIRVGLHRDERTVLALHAGARTSHRFNRPTRHEPPASGLRYAQRSRRAAPASRHRGRGRAR